jgi:hypothetical protein
LPRPSSTSPKSRPVRAYTRPAHCHYRCAGRDGHASSLLLSVKSNVASNIASVAPLLAARVGYLFRRRV